MLCPRHRVIKSIRLIFCSLNKMINTLHMVIAGHNKLIHAFWVTKWMNSYPTLNVPCSPLPPKKHNSRFSVHCNYTVLYCVIHVLISSAKAFSEKNDMKIHVIEFCWVVLILWSFLETQSLSNFVLIHAWSGNGLGLAIHTFFLCSVNLFTWINGLPHSTVWMATKSKYLES